MMGEVILSRCLDPAWNLALEETLMEKESPVLYLWRNGPSVILGRNQNPYRECDPVYLKENGVQLVRRKSGGGAVYHDAGNLNVTMLRHRTPEAVEENFRFLRQVLAELGVQALVSGRNDLEVQGKKISGSAFYETGDMICHHCTLLISAELENLTRYLKPSSLKLQGKGIRSFRGRVANLCESIPGLTPASVELAFLRQTGAVPKVYSQSDMQKNPLIAEKAKVYQSDAWTYGECPSYNLFLEEKFSWGCVRADLKVDSGIIRDCGIYTDSLITEGFRELGNSIRGLPVFGEDLRKAIDESPLPSSVRQDFKKLFSRI